MAFTHSGGSRAVDVGRAEAVRGHRWRGWPLPHVEQCVPLQIRARRLPGKEKAASSRLLTQNLRTDQELPLNSSRPISIRRISFVPAPIA
jgi:hypothetical protein